MDIMELGAIGELVGGIAVIGSLIFVGLQVRQNTRSIRAAAVHESNQSFAQLNTDLTASREVSALIERARQTEPLEDPVDVMRFTAFARGAFLRIEVLFHQHREGFVDPSIWFRRRGFYLSLIRLQPTWSEWWQVEKAFFTKDFVTDFDGALATTEPQPEWRTS